MCPAQLLERFKLWAARRCAFVQIGVCAVKLPNPPVRDFGKIAYLVVRYTVCRLKEHFVRTSTGFHAQCFWCLDITSAPILLSSCLECLTVPNATVQLPDGSVTKVASRAEPILFPNTSTVGVYTVFAGDSKVGRFAVNLLDLKESRGFSSQPVEDRGKSDLVGTPTADHLREVDREIWKYTACLGVLLLLIEWWVYHRNR